jgi:dynein heavy chain
MFDAAVTLLIKVSRAIGMEAGSCVLFGPGGCGKHSLVRLAAYIAGHRTMMFSRTSSASAASDLKAVVRACVQQDSQVTIIVNAKEDTDASAVLDVLNQLMATGQAMELFSRDELDALQHQARAKSAQFLAADIPTGTELSALVSTRLHVALCFSASSTDVIASRCALFPALMSRCHIIYFQAWPEAALKGYAESKLADMNAVVADNMHVIASHMTHVHTSVEKLSEKEREILGADACVYVTPRSFVAYVAHFIEIFEEQYAHVSLKWHDLEASVLRLEEAVQDVNDMKIEVMESETVLGDAGRVSADMLKHISAKSTVAERKRADLKEVKNIADVHMVAVQAIRSDVDKQLEAANPAFEEAENALRNIPPKVIALYICVFVSE